VSMSTDKNNWEKAVLSPDAIIGDAIRNLNIAGIRIILVTNDRNELVGTISDGDIRRGLLKGMDLKSGIAGIIHHDAMVVPPEMSREMVRQLMIANKIYQIPVVDDSHRVLGLHLWDEITVAPDRENRMIIMAGGKGTRLLPHTENVPKPMVMISGKPMLEHIIERGKLEGFTKYTIAIHHLGNVIEEYFGQGERLDVSIEYIREESPLGTAGALGLIASPFEVPALVTNGDVITDIRYSEMLDFHRRHQAAATMAVRLHEWQHPFGVVQTDGTEITGFEEKPVTRSHINAGVYVLSPEALNYVNSGESCDMPQLFERLQAHGKKIVAYPMHEPWLDVGRPDDLVKAKKIENKQ
jgi:dTDP-glucose pyrophosphorylase